MKLFNIISFKLLINLSTRGRLPCLEILSSYRSIQISAFIADDLTYLSRKSTGVNNDSFSDTWNSVFIHCNVCLSQEKLKYTPPKFNVKRAIFREILVYSLAINERYDTTRHDTIRYDTILYCPLGKICHELKCFHRSCLFRFFTWILMFYSLLQCTHAHSQKQFSNPTYVCPLTCVIRVPSASLLNCFSFWHIKGTTFLISNTQPHPVNCRSA